MNLQNLSIQRIHPLEHRPLILNLTIYCFQNNSKKSFPTWYHGVKNPFKTGAILFSNKSDTMFNNISWSSYLLITAVITATYYFIIGVIYYRNEITKILFSHNSDFINTPAKARRENVTVNSDFNEEELNQTIENEKVDACQSYMVHELMNKLNKVFKNASDKKFLKEELILALQLTLENYLQLKESPFSEAINSLIELESQSQCSIYLNDDEMKLLWKEGR